MKVGILGSGDVGRALGTGFVETGHEVMIGTRHPSEPALTDWKRTAGARALIGSFAEAAAFGELIVVAAQGSATLDVLGMAGAERFRGKVVIDATNPLSFSAQGAPSLFVGQTDSLGEQVQRALPGARVVKAFNTVGNEHFFRPSFPGGPPEMLIAGDDAAAKRTVSEVLREFGWSPVDIGGIEGARVLEPLCVAWVRCARALGTRDIAFKLLRK